MDALLAAPAPTSPSRRAALGAWIRRHARVWRSLRGPGLVLLAGLTAVGVYRIPSASMAPTLHVGDRVVLNQLAFGVGLPGVVPRLHWGTPRRGQVVTFYPPFVRAQWGTRRAQFIKRVIGLPGDTIEMRAGRVFVNQRPLDEPYVQHDHRADASYVTMAWQRAYLPRHIPPASYRPTRDQWGPLLVPAGRYFVLGDHRDDSADSRYWGFVARDDLSGTPLLIWHGAR